MSVANATACREWISLLRTPTIASTAVALEKHMNMTATSRAPGSIPLERPKQIVARADALLYLHVARPDLNKATKFVTDFGLRPAGRQADTEHFRGVGENPVIYSVTRADRPVLLSVGRSVPDRETLLALTKSSPSRARAVARWCVCATRTGFALRCFTARRRSPRFRADPRYRTTRLSARFASMTRSVHRLGLPR